MTFLDLQNRPKVLCIDDDPAIVTAIERHLARYDVEVHTAFLGKQGIWTAVTETPDVIITDLRMPHGNGEYVVECLKGRSDTCEIPVIVLTGQRDPQIKRWMMTLGIERYLQKPLRMEKLVHELGKLIDMEPNHQFGSDATRARPSSF